MGRILMSAKFDIATTPIHPGLSVIEASAGTGKTYTITRLVPRLLLDSTVGSLSEILLLTYTKDAAGELADRVRHVLESLISSPGPDEKHRDPGLHALRCGHSAQHIATKIGQALLDIDRLNVSTIHSFCQRVLQDESVLCGLPVMPELLTDRSELVHEVLQDIWEAQVSSDPVLAALATVGSLSLTNDAELAGLASVLEDFEPRPAVQNLSNALDSLSRCRHAFNEPLRMELREFLDSVPVNAWSKDSQSESLRANHLEALDPASPLERWIPAIHWLKTLSLSPGGAIKSTSKANKALIAGSASLRFSQVVEDAAAVIHAIPRAWQIHALRSVITTVGERLESGRQVTYDGLVRRVRDALLHGPGRATLLARLRRRFRVALVDESQDTDPAQFAIFKSIFLEANGEEPPSDHRLVLVGDPKQAIYAFRGADLNTYLAARDNSPPDNRSTLNCTFRAPEALVRAVNAFFRSPRSFHNPGITFEPARSGLGGEDCFLDDGPDASHRRVEVWLAPDEEAKSFSSNRKRLRRISGEVATEITRLLSSGTKFTGGRDDGRHVHPGDFAVLVSRHTEAKAVKDALYARNIPCVAAGADDIMSSEEATELFRILSALDAPRRKELRFAALSTRMLGYDDASLAALASTENSMLEEFTAWQATMTRHGIAAALAETDRDTGLSTRLASTTDGERRLTNFRQLTDLLQSAFLTHGNRSGRLLRWFGAEINRATQDGKAPAEERQQQLERDTKAVRIVTMHSAKGLEYPLVFCPFLGAPVEGGGKSWKILADPSVTLPLLVFPEAAGEETLEALRAAAFEDRLRLAYVAMTRAKVKLWIYAGATTTRPQRSVLDWLLCGGGEETPEADSLRGSTHAAGLVALTKAGSASDVIFTQPPPPALDNRWKGGAMAALAPLAALPAPVLPGAWTMTSFSGLTREKNPKGDDGTAFPEPPPDPTNELVPEDTFLDAPGGAAMGTAVHDWIERWDFSAPDPSAVRDHFARYNLPQPPIPPPLHERITAMLSDLRSSRLPFFGCTVAAACPDPAASEWHFQLPVEDGISPLLLAKIFDRHGHKDYAPMLEALEKDELPGYLHGFMDRIAFHAGQWGVIDWKTNRLGGTAAIHRDPETLLAASMRSHYLLQMHLYLVALRRFLGRTTAAPTAWLVFLRGVRADSADGILEIRPSESFLDDLDQLFRRPAP